jgi:hypothetical protein
VNEFLAWGELQDITSIADVRPLHVGTYVEILTRNPSAPTAKQVYGWGPMIYLDQARQKAATWCAAWNSRDLDAIMTHYVEDVTFSSPTVVSRWGYTDGWLCRKAKLRENFAVGVKAPGLRFELVDVLVGVNAICIILPPRSRNSGERSGRTPLADQGLFLALRGSWARSCLLPLARRIGSAGPDVVR